MIATASIDLDDGPDPPSSATVHTRVRCHEHLIQPGNGRQTTLSGRWAPEPLNLEEAFGKGYQAQVAPLDPRTFLLYEQYTDKAGYEEHKATPHFQEHVFGYVIEYLEEREVTTYTTLRFLRS